MLLLLLCLANRPDTMVRHVRNCVTSYKRWVPRRSPPPTGRSAMTSAVVSDQRAGDTPSNTADLVPLSSSLLLSVEHILWKPRTWLTELNRYDGQHKSISSQTHRWPLTTLEHTVSPKQQQQQQRWRQQQQQLQQPWSLTTPTKINLSMSFLASGTPPRTSEYSTYPVIHVGGSKTNRLHVSELRLDNAKELRRRATDEADSGFTPNNEGSNFALRSLSPPLDGSTFYAPVFRSVTGAAAFERQSQ